MAKHGADKGTLSKDGVFIPGGQYGAPGGVAVGTGPFRSIPNNADHLQALQTGEIQGYDLVEPQDLPTIKKNPTADDRWAPRRMPLRWADPRRHASRGRARVGSQRLAGRVAGAGAA